jgi:hypothetical protein
VFPSRADNRLIKIIQFDVMIITLPLSESKGGNNFWDGKHENFHQLPIGFLDIYFVCI